MVASERGLLTEGAQKAFLGDRETRLSIVIRIHKN